MNEEKGITLVALVVTIIILLILAGITISQLTNIGLFEKTKLAKEKTEKSEKIENERLDEYIDSIHEYIDGSNRDTKKSGYNVTLIWEGTGNAGDSITLINGHKFNEFDTVRFVYSNFSDNNNKMFGFGEKYEEILIETINSKMDNKDFFITLSGYSDYYMWLNNFNDTSFSIKEQRNYKLDKIYGINY